MKRKNNKNRKLIKLASKFKPFDFGFLLEIEKQALKQMADYLANSDIAEGNERRAAEIRLALKLLNIGDETESAYILHPDSMSVYVNTRNWKRFFPPDINLDFEKPILQDALRVEKAWHLYCVLRENRMRWWWD